MSRWCTGGIGGERGINSSLLPSQFASVREWSAVPSAWQTGENDRKEVLWLEREKGTANICKNTFLTRATGLKSLRENKNYIIFLSYSSWSGSKDWKMVRTPPKEIFVLNGNKRIQAKSWDKPQCGIRIYGGRKKDGKEVPWGRNEGRELKVFISRVFFLETETVGAGSFKSFRGKL